MAGDAATHIAHRELYCPLNMNFFIRQTNVQEIGATLDKPLQF